MVKMWKPTKEGVYRHGGKEAHVMYPGTISFSDGPTPRYCPDDFDPVATCPDDWRRWQGRLTPVPDGLWSLMGPDWQPGAPTVAQLERWQWWAFGIQSNGENSAVCGLVDHSSQFGLTQVGGCYYLTRTITRSAPVQPIPGEVLWVPLEVCNG